ncbi:Chondroitinase-AC [Trichoderma lentiforme]|uniref:Chondroitinase-AC n=1 Tax=Trichoderma lentiforme TaxID=1567552 RepID=A0A9P4XCX9_9HYPO|nr:Chondroitinase-AC [Trichoderma lentiforme]
MKLNSLVGLVAATAGVAQAASSDDSLALFAKRRTADLSQFPDPTWFAKIDTWLSSQKADGTWSDVNYASGCPAQRANWPIQEHWNRLITFGAAWSGVNPAVSSTWAKDPKLLTAVQKGLDYWFSNDYTPADCMGDGGNASKGCPCDTPGLWNTNWYDQAILIPQLCSTACLLVKDANLTETQRAGCERIPNRAYALRDGTYGTGGRMTGANMVLVMQNSVTLALFTDNSTILSDAMIRAMSVMTFVDTPGDDGIHRDGTFLQHDGLLYNGNYGKDLLNAFIQLEGEAIGTSFAADDSTREAMSTYIKGDEWMIYTDSDTKTEHWDFNAIGRFVSFPTVDLQASADINFNVSKLATAVADFTGSYAVNDTIRRLLSNGTEKLTGNKGFWASDYMVHRRPGFVLTNKMISTRSSNSESVNGANPYAYHMGQGTLYSYVKGNEYKDIMAQWDWNLVPGTTTLLNQPKLQATQVKYDGLKDFVGVVSDGKFGAAVEDYLDPLTQNLSYRKSWFFVDEGVIVITTDIKKNSTAGNTPVITVLDNRAAEPTKPLLKNGPLSKLGEQHSTSDTLYYANNGYLAYDTPFELTISLGKRSGNWSEISTSTQGVKTADIFSAYTTIKGSQFTYGYFPSISSQKLNKELEEPTWNPITKKGISGIYGKDRASLAFWPGGDKSVALDLKALGWAKAGTLTFTSDQPAVYLISAQCKDKKSMRLVVTLADPTQKLAVASYSIKISGQGHKVREMGEKSEGLERRGDGGIGFGVRLPTGGLAGSSVSREVILELD